MHARTRMAAAAGGVLALVGAQGAPGGSSPAAGAEPAAGRSVVHVTGTQVPVDPDNGVYAMRGGLRGPWKVTSSKVLHQTKRKLVIAGHERFRGCLDENGDRSCGAGETKGSLRFSFLYWASFDKQGNLVRGQCVHPVTGGTQGFAGTRGVLRMFDRPVGDSVRTTYRGNLALRG